MLISEKVKIDHALLPMALNNTNTTGRYYDMSGYRRALFILMLGAMASTKTGKIEVLEAKDESGTDAAALSGATCTVTANNKVTKMTITLATAIAGDAITINGLVFTGKAGAASYADREFSIDTSDTAAAASLVLCINHATYGVPGVLATSALGVVTIIMYKESDPEPNSYNDYLAMGTITASSDDATVTIATVEALAFVEVDASSMSDDMTHLAAKVTVTANTVVAVPLLRGDPRNTPTQEVGASASL